MYGYNQDACGVYTPGTQFNVDENKLRELGFSQDDIGVMQYVSRFRGKVSVADLQANGIEYERACKIKYMYDIAIGRVNIESEDDLAKHFRKMFGNHRRIGITDLAVSKVNKVPRWALIGGIKDEVYSCLNSKNLPPEKRLYTVEKVGSRVTVSTDNRIVIPYEYPMKIDGVIEILGKEKQTGRIVMAIDRNYCRLCNRYIIVASLRAPETHHGMVQIICVEGTKLYVYAKTLGIKESVSYSGGTARVYDYGIKANEIIPRVRAVAEAIYQSLCGVYAKYIPANEDFQLLAPIQKDIEIQD